MKIVYTRRAEIHMAGQLVYGIEQYGKPVATRTIIRLRRFVRDTVTVFPRAASYLPEPDLDETWVPGTPFVVVYRYSEVNRRSLCWPSSITVKIDLTLIRTDALRVRDD